MIRRLRNIVLRSVLWISLTILLLFVIATTIIRIPQIQTRIVTSLSDDLSNTLGLKAYIGYVNLNWFDVLVIRDVEIKDHHDSTLIRIDEGIINYSLTSFLNRKHRVLDKVSVNGGLVNLAKYNEDEPVNFTFFVDSVKYNLIKKKSGSRNRFRIRNASLKGVDVHYKYWGKEYLEGVFDLNQFDIENLSGGLSELTAIEDTLEFTAINLSGFEPNIEMPLNHLSTRFRLCQKSISLSQLDMHAGDSHLTDSIIFTFDTLAALSDFQNSVQMHIRLIDSRVFSDDLGKFSPYFSKINDLYTISGSYSGNVPDFQVRNLSVKFGDRSFINGNLSFTGLPRFEETFITARFNNAGLEVEDVKKYVTSEFYEKIVALNYLRMNGSFNGFPGDFVADGEFITSLGLINSDINLKTANNSYSGNLMMQEFQLGRYFGSPDFGNVSLSGNIVGSGFTLESADFVLKGDVSKIGIKNYDYVNINTNARFASEFFEGSLKIDDPNLAFNMEGTIDLRENYNKVELTAVLDTAILHNLNLTNTSTFLSSEMDLDFTGLQIDSVRGNAVLKNLKISTDFNSLNVDDLSLVSDIKADSSRELRLLSEKLDISINGKFNLTDAYSDLSNLVREYILNVENNSEEISRYYAAKKPAGKEYELQYDVNVKDINSIIRLFAPDLTTSNVFDIEGRFQYGVTSLFTLYSSIDSITYRNSQFVNNSFDIFSSKVSDSTDILAQFQVSSLNQKYGEKSETNNLFTELIWNENKVDYSLFIEQDNLDSHARILGDITFIRDSTVIRIKPSDIKLLDDPWTVLANNSITVSGKTIAFDNVGVERSDELIVLNGEISEESERYLDVKVENFGLEILNPVLPRSLTGILNGSLQLSDYYANRKYEINSYVDSLGVDGIHVGDVLSLSSWDKDRRQFNLGFNIFRDAINILDVNGVYAPFENQVDLDIELDSVDIGIAETFIKDYFTKMKGKATGNFNIEGDPSDPVMSGEGIIEGGSIHVNYLKTTYNFNSAVIFQENEMGFRDLVVTDKNNNSATFNGGFFHEGGGIFSMEFEGDFDNLLALNTTLSDNSLFYGTAIGSGNMLVSGYPSNLSISVTAETNRGTRIFIPLSGESTINQEDFIQFVSFTKEVEEDTLTQKVTGRTLIKGLDFQLDLTINENAYAEIIFDQKVGDIIRGRGNGNMNIQLNKNGDFSMLGDYVFTEGGYNFTLYNIINKEFEILPDSKIAWYGDPYEGVLDIKASYDQLASIAPLLDTAYRSAPELGRRYPTSVILDLKGPLLSPEIFFDIKVREYPTTAQSNTDIINLETEMNAVYANWKANEQELQKQVFSLIVLKKFSEDYFNTGGTVGSSVSEFVSNQLSYWISQVDENLEIDINLGQLSEEAYNTFQLRLSYTFLDGRLRVTRDGGFYTDEVSRSNIGSIVGDWSVEYALSENGNLRVKLYQKSNYYTSTTLYQDPSVFTGGFSLIYSQSFDEVKEIFGKARSNKQTQNLESKGKEEQKDEKKGDPSSSR